MIGQTVKTEIVLIIQVLNFLAFGYDGPEAFGQHKIKLI